MIAQGNLTSEYLKEKAEEVIRHGANVTVLDLKKPASIFLNVSDEKKSSV